MLYLSCSVSCFFLMIVRERFSWVGCLGLRVFVLDLAMSQGTFILFFLDSIEVLFFTGVFKLFIRASAKNELRLMCSRDVQTSDLNQLG